MRFPGPSLLFVMIISFASVSAQNSIPVAHFRRGDIRPLHASIPDIRLSDLRFQQSVYKGRLHILFQFSKIPTQQQQTRLLAEGVELIEYIPDNTYLAALTKNITADKLRELKVVNSIVIDRFCKIDIGAGSSAQQSQTTQFLISAFPGIDNKTLVAELSAAGIPASEYKKGWEGIVVASLLPMQLDAAAQLPFVYFIEEYPGEELPLNDESAVLHSTNILSSSAAGIGRNLEGKGVVIGIGDMGGVGIHPDHQYKTISFLDPGVYHSLHVSGITAGAGLLNPRIKGRAPEATLITMNYAEIVNNAPNLFQTYGMLLTNNSYGTGAAVCRNFGAYNSLSKFVDQQLLTYPEIMHVVAAGNETTSYCGLFPQGYHTVFGGYQSSKNCITVGGSNKFDKANVYSKGPTNDGRMKPEITSAGRDVYATTPITDYGPNYGTSMAAPQVTGTLALLIERYRQLNNGNNPPAALLKTVLCNAAEDIGQTGPDYANGYGWLNALPAVHMLENRSYFASSVQQQQEQTFTVVAGQDLQELRIMLYWPDRPASLYSLISLVNDLDMVVTSPNGSVYRPLTLDSSAGGVLRTATNGEDHINNMEQIVIRNPVAGNYLVRVKGHVVPLGSQDFFISHYGAAKDFTIINPLEGDTWKAGEKQLIAWEENGLVSGSYTVEFSPDAGASWQTLGNSTGINKNLSITVPVVQTLHAAIRVRNTITGNSATSNEFVILPEVTPQLSSPCDGYINIQWPAVLGIDSFSVFFLERGEMKIKSTLTSNNLQLGGFNKDSSYWVAIAPWKNGVRGERSIAKGIQPTSTQCSLEERNGDIEVVGFYAPNTGRMFTSTQRGSNENIVIGVRNIDDQPTQGSIFLKLYVNEVLFDSYTINSSIAPAAYFYHNFDKKINLSVPGEYRFRLTAEKADDPVLSNNVSNHRIKILANLPISLPFEEKFSTLKDTVYSFPYYYAIDGAEAWDFTASNKAGRLKTRLRSGTLALIPDKIHDPRTSIVQNVLTATYNMSAYSLSDPIYVSVNTDSGFAGGGLWVRGSDTSKWLSLGIFDPAAPSNGQFHRNITKVLTDSGQKYSTSFQFKIDGGYFSEYEKNLQTYVGSLRFYILHNDVAVYHMNNNASTFFKTDTLAVKFAVLNNGSKQVERIPVHISHKTNGILIRDTIPVLTAYDSVQTTWRIPIDKLTTSRADSFFISVNYPADEYISNNRARVFLGVTPSVDSFPYLDGLENSGSQWTGSLFYQLTGHQNNRYGYKSANGIHHFYPRNEEQFSLEPRQMTISSVGIDLSKMKNPYISFSALRYMRPGKDSGYVMISYNNGASFRKLNSLDAYNWYNFKNNTVWSDSSQLFWAVVTCKLPDTNKRNVLIRILTQRVDSTKYPIWTGGLGVDDLHVYDLTYPILETGTVNASGNISLDKNSWQELVHNDRIHAAVQSKLSSSNLLNWEIKSFAKPVTILNGKKILSKRWIFKPSKSTQQTVGLRLYFTEEEASLLRAMNNCVNCADTLGAYDFNVIQYTGPARSIDPLRANNIGSGYQMIHSSSFHLVPYHKGYYAEINVLPEGEFYVQLPERSNNLSVNLNAVTDVSRLRAELNWTVTDWKEIDRYELELATGDDQFEENNFSTLRSWSSGPNNEVQFTHVNLLPAITYHYRLKLIYKNGYVRYSNDQASEIGRAPTTQVYPNPSTGIFYLVVPQYFGSKIEWQVSNTLGQVLITNSKSSSGSLGLLTLDMTAAVYAPGVYLLKIFNGGNTEIIRLIKK